MLVRAVLVRAVRVRTVPVRTVPVRAVPVRAVPVCTVPVRTVPVRAVPVCTVPVRTVRREPHALHPAGSFWRAPMVQPGAQTAQRRRTANGAHRWCVKK